MRKEAFYVTIIALILGIIFGVFFGEKTEFLGNISLMIVRLLKAFATPVLFFAICDAVLNAEISFKGMSVMLGVSLINATVAISIALIVSSVFTPSKTFMSLNQESASSIKKPAELTLDKILDVFFPESLLSPFLENSTITIISMALIFGFALRKIKNDTNSKYVTQVTQLSGMVALLFKVSITIIEWLVVLVPLAVFASVAKSVGKNGISFLSELGSYLAACMLGMFVHVFVTCQGWVIAHPFLSLKKFWQKAKAPALYSFGINSSLATMPLTLNALEEMDLSPESARLSVCVGTNFNNDGILLYEVVAAIFLTQALGVDLNIWSKLWIALSAIFATLGVSGFPEAGVVALTLVLSTVGIPSEALVPLLAVDWLVARCRSATNVLSDMAVAIGVDLFSVKKTTLYNSKK